MSRSAPTTQGSNGAHTPPSIRAAGDALCAALMRGVHGGSPSVHCKATNVRTSAVDPDWVYGSAGLYGPGGEPASDIDQVMLNLRTHQLIGPTSVGFCTGPGRDQPIGAFGTVPSDVLASLGLRRCGSGATSSPSSSGTGGTAAFSRFAGNWGSHESGLTMTGDGRGHLNYADLRGCLSCSQADAPRATLDFALTTIAAGTGSGSVTASSDVKVWAVGAPVVVTLSAGSPGHVLEVTIAGKQLVAFCDATSVGQCGA